MDEAGLELNDGRIQISSWIQHYPAQMRSYYVRLFAILEAGSDSFSRNNFIKILNDHNLRILPIQAGILGIDFNFVIVRDFDDNGAEVGEVDSSVYTRIGNVDGFASLDLALEKVIAGTLSELEFQSMYWIESRAEYESLIKFYKAMVGLIRLDEVPD